MVGPAEHAWLIKSAIDDQLPPALEQVDESELPIGPVELIVPCNRQPRHSAALGGQRIPGAGVGLFRASVYGGLAGLVIAAVVNLVWLKKARGPFDAKKQSVPASP